jgi:IS30 family transposase
MARHLNRAASTISRELRRNAATRSGGFDYRATTAPLVGNGGTPNARHVDRGWQNWHRTSACAVMCRTVLPA